MATQNIKYFLVENEEDVKAMNEYLKDADDLTPWCEVNIYISFLERGGYRYPPNLPLVMEVHGKGSRSKFKTKTEWIRLHTAHDPSFSPWYENSSREYYNTTYGEDMGYV